MMTNEATVTSKNNKFELPIIDISPFVLTDVDDDDERKKQQLEQRRIKVIKEWDDAFTNVGFVMIQGHGVPETLIEKLRSKAKEFFEQTPLKEKISKYHRGPYGNYDGGYTPMGNETVSQSRTVGNNLGSDGGSGSSGGGSSGGGSGSDNGKNDDGTAAESTTATTGTIEASKSKTLIKAADLVESYILRPHQVHNDPPGLANLGMEYRNHMKQLLSVLHEISALSLGLDKDYFVPFYQDNENQLSLRLGYYPECTKDTILQPGTLRYGEHTDYTGFTILLQDDSDGDGGSDGTAAAGGGGGLEVKLPTGEFYAVQAIPNTFVVNIGDMFQVWTNDKWKSTVHRVAGPKGRCPSRLSIPFFTGPNDDAQIAPIVLQPGETAKHETITAGEHLRRKLQATQT